MKTHGLSRTAYYHRWSSMKDRCTNPKHPKFKDYGGRGIVVCKRWEKFENFFLDMGLPPTSHHQLERKNNSLGYTPKNCTWATLVEQHNNYRQNKILSWNGKTMTAAQWADLLGFSRQMVWQRIKKGWSAARILTQKPRKHIQPYRERLIKFDGKTLNIGQWAKETGITRGALVQRLLKGWTIERALTEKQRGFPKTREYYRNREG